jgi:alanyl-tRNA synthetase
MGADVVTIDFDGPIPQEDLQEIENTVNAGIWANFSVKCWYPAEEELPNVPYRRKKDLPWPVRIVEFPAFDICACCGTQVKRTGEIGMVKLLSCVKFHEGVRIEMVCGKRALQLLSDAYEQNKQVSQAFSAKIGETGQAARRMNETLAAEKFRSTGSEKRLFAYIAQGYTGKTLALHFEETLTPNGNRELCDAIADFAAVAVTLSGTDENGYSICIISRTQDAKAIGTEAAKALNGRGGGKKEAFQGNLRASRQEIEAYFTL